MSPTTWHTTNLEDSFGGKEAASLTEALRGGPKDIIETDPSETHALWNRVTASNKARNTVSMSTSGRSRRGKSAAQSTSDSYSLRSATSVEAAESDSTPRSAVTSSRSVNPRNSKFVETVLTPCRIRIHSTNTIVPSAFVHFGTEEPIGGYKALDQINSPNIWVEMKDVEVNRITSEYQAMRGLGLCETEFASLAKECFLRREWKSSKETKDRRWGAERMLDLVCPPNENAHWRKPPIQDESIPHRLEWSWDVRPDCSYWLSLKGFNPRYCSQIQNCTFVRDYITCPYFSVEFKRDGEPENAAVAQVAAAASLALFNRYCLHSESLQVSPNSKKDSSAIRHYALTFVGPKFVVWILQPDVEENKWKGCTMKRLVGADTSDEYGVKELSNWINEIHRWGLSIHAQSCQADIKAVLNIGGVRTSDTHFADGVLTVV